MIKIEKVEVSSSVPAFLSNLFGNNTDMPSTYYVYTCETYINGEKKIFEVDEKFLARKGLEVKDYFKNVIASYEADVAHDLEADCSTI